MAYAGASFYEDVRPAESAFGAGGSVATRSSSTSSSEGEGTSTAQPTVTARTSQQHRNVATLDAFEVTMPIPLPALLGANAHKELQRMRGTRGYKAAFTDGPPRSRTPLLPPPPMAVHSSSGSPPSLLHTPTFSASSATTTPPLFQSAPASTSSSSMRGDGSPHLLPPRQQQQQPYAASNGLSKSPRHSAAGRHSAPPPAVEASAVVDVDTTSDAPPRPSAELPSHVVAALEPLINVVSASGDTVRSSSAALVTQQAEIDAMRRELEAKVASLANLRSAHAAVVQRHADNQTQLAFQRRSLAAQPNGAQEATVVATLDTIRQLAELGRADAPSKVGAPARPALFRFASPFELEEAVSVSMPTVRPLVAFASSFVLWESCCGTANSIERKLRASAALVADVCPALKFIDTLGRFDVAAKPRSEAERCLLEMHSADNTCPNLACTYYHANAHTMQWKATCRLLAALSVRAVSPEIDVTVRRAAADLVTHVTTCDDAEESVAATARDHLAALLRYVGTRVAHKGWLGVKPFTESGGVSASEKVVATVDDAGGDDADQSAQRGGSSNSRAMWLLMPSLGDTLAATTRRLYGADSSSSLSSSALGLHPFPVRFAECARQSDFRGALNAALESLCGAGAADPSAPGGDSRAWCLALAAAKQCGPLAYAEVAALALRALPSSPAVIFASVEAAAADLAGAEPRSAEHRQAIALLRHRVALAEDVLANAALVATVQLAGDGLRLDAADVDLVATPAALQQVTVPQRQLAAIVAFAAVAFANADAREVEVNEGGVPLDPTAMLMQRFLRPFLKPSGLLQPTAVCNLTLMCIEQLTTGKVDPNYPVGMVPEYVGALHFNASYASVSEPRRARAVLIAESMLEWVTPAIAAVRLSGPRALSSSLGRTLSRIESVTRSVLWTLQSGAPGMTPESIAKLFNVKHPTSSMGEAWFAQIARLCAAKDRRLLRIARQAAVTLAHDCVTCLRIYGLLRRQHQPGAAQVFAKVVVDTNATERCGLSTPEALAEALLAGRDGEDWAMPSDEAIALCVLTAAALCAVDAEFTATRLLTTRWQHVRRPEPSGVCGALIREACTLESGSSGSTTLVAQEIRRRLKAAATAEAIWQRGLDVGERGNHLIGLAHVEAADMWARPLQLLHTSLWNEASVRAVQEAVLEAAIAANCVHPCMRGALTSLRQMHHPAHGESAAASAAWPLLVSIPGGL